MMEDNVILSPTKEEQKELLEFERNFEIHGKLVDSVETMLDYHIQGLVNCSDSVDWGIAMEALGRLTIMSGYRFGMDQEEITQYVSDLSKLRPK